MYRNLPLADNMIGQLRKLWVVILIFPLQLIAQNTEISLIPQPSKIQILQGELDLHQNFEAFLFEEFADLADLISEIPGVSLAKIETIKKVKKQHNIGIRLFKAKEYDQVAANGYLLEVDESGILLKANTKEGMISGIFTLVQLSYLADKQSIPYLRINDQPKFPYRGLHLDASSQYMPFDFMKKYIDLMALYKFNYFHWQLTGGAGWRIEIKKYPELTNKAAWRTHKDWTEWRNNGMQYISQGHPNASGGFYTQEQARELVDYAAKRGITIIPEIKIPGHTHEILAVYPELGCTTAENNPAVLCFGNEKSYEFLKNVLDEVIAIFPSRYIHIGGEQADTTSWKLCEKCQNLIKKDSLGSSSELQSLAIKQIEDYLITKDRNLIGWDDVLAHNVSKKAQIMVGKDIETAKNAASEDYKVIVSVEDFLNLSNYQKNPKEQQDIRGDYLPLEKVYSFNPMPKELPGEKKNNILGAQANLWSKQTPTFQEVEYMVYPRAIALSEVLWSNQELSTFSNFNKRLQQHYALLQKLQVNYYPPSFSVTTDITFDSLNRKNTVLLSSEQFTPKIRYTVDGSVPDKNSTLYNLPLELTQTSTIKAASFVDSVRVSEVEKIELDVHKAIGKEVKYLAPWDQTYAAQNVFTLTNGVKGGITLKDGQWQGFTKSLNAVIDFERREEISSIAMNFIQVRRQQVYFPEELIISISDNAKNYREIAVIKNQSLTADSALQYQKFELQLAKPVMARYIQVKAAIPDDKIILTDEIVVY